MRAPLLATRGLQVHRGTTSSYLLLHNKEERPPVAQAFGVKAWGQHIGVINQGAWQQWHRRGEGTEDPDDVGVRGQLLGTSLGPSISAKWDKYRNPVSDKLVGKIIMP